MPELALLQAFECAARHGNFTQAAAELSLTQSAVSRQIKSLEAQLGVLLFERIRKRVILSAAGRRFLPEVSRLLLQSEEMVLRARASADGINVLSIATLPTFGSRWLLPRLPEFLDRYSDISVNIGSRSEPFDFAAEDFDLAIHYGQPIWPHAACTFLFDEMVVPLASSSLCGPDAEDRLDCIQAGPLLHLATRPRQWADWFELYGLHVENAYRGNRFDQFAMIIEATLRGLGFALLPLYMVEEEIASGRLRVVSDSPIKTDNGYYIVMPEDKQNNVSGQAFKAWLLSKVKVGAAS